MPIEVIMPKVDMDMSRGTLRTWHVEVGAAVSKGDPLFDIETDKAAMEVEAQNDGILYHPVAEGTVVSIGQPVAWLYAGDEDVGDAPKDVSVAEVGHRNHTANRSVKKPAETAPPAEIASTGKIRATPLARSRAHATGVDITTLTGSGPRGRVQAEDVPRNSNAASPTPISFTPESGPLSVTQKKGGTGIPIVLIHGFGSDAKSWAPLEPHLSDHPLIRIDLPCHGKSPFQRVDKFGDLVGAFRDTFDDLQLDSIHLVGHSLGGAVALALADTRPRGVRSLNLIAPAGLGPEINGATLNGIARATRATSLAPWLTTLVHDETLITEGYINAVMANRTKPTMRAAQIALVNAIFPDGTQAFDLRSALGRVKIPTRLIWGQQDNIIPWQHALTAPGRIALHIFAATGHIPHIERTDEVGKLLQSSL